MAEKRQTPSKKTSKVDLKKRDLNPVPRRDSSSDKLLSDTAQASSSPDDKTLSVSVQASLQVKDEKVVRRSPTKCVKKMICCGSSRPDSSSDTQLSETEQASSSVDKLLDTAEASSSVDKLLDTAEASSSVDKLLDTAEASSSADKLLDIAEASSSVKLLDTAEASSSADKLLDTAEASSSAGDTAQATADVQKEEFVPTHHTTGIARDVARSVLDVSPSVKREENLPLPELSKSPLVEMPLSPTAETQVSEQPEPSRPCPECDPNMSSPGSVCSHIARAARRLEFGGQTEPTQIQRDPRNPVFGSKLDDDVVDGGQDVPRVVVRCVAIVEAWCQRNKLDCVFTYKTTESSSEERKAIKTAFVKGEDEDLGKINYSARSYADVLKQYLRELPDPVIPANMYIMFIDFVITGSVKGFGREFKTMADLVSAMPSRHRSTLQALLRHFTKLLRWQAESNPEGTYKGDTLFREVSHVLMRPPWNRIGQIRDHIKIYNDILSEMIRAGCWEEEPPNIPKVISFTMRASPTTDYRGFAPQLPEERLKDAPWYWPHLTKEEAIATVMPHKQGSFLVRDSSEPGCYVLLLKMKNEVKSIKILCRDNHYGFVEATEYSSLLTMIDWYRSHYLTHYNDTLTTKLRYPILMSFTPKIPMGSINQQIHVYFMIKQRCRKRRAMYFFLRKCQLWLISDTELKYQAIGAYDELNNMLQEQIEHLKRNNPSDHADIDRLSALCDNIQKCKSILKSVDHNNIKLRLNQREMVTLQEEIIELEGQLKIGLDRLKEQGFSQDYLDKLANLDESLWFVDCQHSEAESRLLHKRNGTFLIRPKLEEDTYALSVMHNGTVGHCIIYHEYNSYGFAKDNLCFISLKDLVDYHSYRSLPAHRSDLDICLLFPVIINEHNAESERNRQPQAAHPEQPEEELL